jgi:hypothetical protein
VAQGEGPEFKPQYHKKKKNPALLFEDTALMCLKDTALIS